MPFTPVPRSRLPQYAPISISSPGDSTIVLASPPYQLIFTSYLIDANGLDQVVTFKSGGNGGGQSNTILAPFTVGPAVNIPIIGVAAANGCLGTIHPWASWNGPDPNTPDDFVISVEGASGNTTILLTGFLTFFLR